MIRSLNYIFFFISFAGILSTVHSSILNDCSEDASGKLLFVNVSGCDFDNDATCKLLKGQDAGIQVQFEALRELTQVKVKIAGKIGFVSIPFIVMPDEACGNWNVTCPVEPSDKQTFAISLPVKSVYPSVDVQVQVELLDQKMRQITCVTFPAKIVNN